MNEAHLAEKLNELVKEFGAVSEPVHNKLAMLAREARKNRQELEKSVDLLQQSLDYLRICIKYQAFDLEATKRENKYLRTLLEGEDK